MVTRVASIMFFLVFGISEFITIAYVNLLLGVLALVVAIAMLANA